MRLRHAGALCLYAVHVRLRGAEHRRRAGDQGPAGAAVRVLSSLMAGLLMGWAAFFHGDVLAGIFADDPAVIAAAWEYLKGLRH